MSYESFLQAQERRIYYHIHQLRIPYAYHEEFYAEGMVILWQAYEAFDPEQGELNAFLNARLRLRFIDLIRRNTRRQEVEREAEVAITNLIATGNKIKRSNQHLLDVTGIYIFDASLFHEIRNKLTQRQWKWLYSYVIEGYKLREIAERENVELEAVKGWAKAARAKLRQDPDLKKRIKKSIEER